MKSITQSRKLNRYTTLPILLHLLRSSKLVLLDPSTWEDRNDSQIILEYKKRKRIPNLFAVCFSFGNETIHNWIAYASGIAGCCIQFDEQKLLNSFQNIKQIRWGEINYKTIRQIKENTIKPDQIPFTKRYPYRVEKEFRIIWEGKTKHTSIEVQIDLNCIEKITISQSMPDNVYEIIAELLRDELKKPKLQINKSTVFENNIWISSFKKRNSLN